MGTVFELAPWRFTVTADEVVQAGQKIYYVDVFVGSAGSSRAVSFGKRSQKIGRMVKKATPRGNIPSVDQSLEH